MSMWAAIVLVGLGSYVFRVVPMLLGERLRLSESADLALRHAAVGAMTGLLVLGAGGVADDPLSPAAIAVGAALAVSTALAFLGRSMLVVVVCGGAAYGLVLVTVGALLA